MAKIAWDAAPKTGNPEVDQFLQDMLEIAKASHVKGTGVETIVGSGSPEGVYTAKVGTTFRRTDGGASTSFYVKESGDDTNTGWVAK